MLRTFYGCIAAQQNVVPLKSHVRHLSFHKFKKAYKNYFQPIRTPPPYSHICQVGDPVLRTQASPVDPAAILTEDFQKILLQMKNVMKKYNTVGLAAPQIGVPYQIFAVGLTEEQLGTFDREIVKAREMEVIPFHIFINPTMKITDRTLLKFPESCESIRGYSADVPRARAVLISALNASGKPGTWEAKGWASRIAQHEMDHLKGKVYIDVMDPSTFACSAWEAVNAEQGRIIMRFYPK